MSFFLLFADARLRLHTMILSNIFTYGEKLSLGYASLFSVFLFFYKIIHKVPIFPAPQIV